MSLKVRKIVTGHDENGRAIVAIDKIADNVLSKRPGYSSAVIWASHSFPEDNESLIDESKLDVPTSLPNGTVFRVVRYEPGIAPRVHRTESLDYAIVISGEIDMELEPGHEIHVKTGDVLVQRGTVHNWIHRGSEPCVIAYVVTSAKPLSVGSKPLEAFG